MGRRATPEVNAGSMADIAFLLLIFFLVTTTIEKDKGIARQLPPIEPPTEAPPLIKEKNLFIVNVNKDDQLLVEDNLMELKDLRQAAIDFLDNGGAPQGSPEYCSYCKGARSASSSVASPLIYRMSPSNSISDISSGSFSIRTQF